MTPERDILAEVYDYVAKRGGATDAELARALAITLGQARTARTKLCRVGRLSKFPDRRRSPRGQLQTVWVPAQS